MASSLLLGATLSAAEPVLSPSWSQLPSIPDPEGFAGMIAGVSDDALVAAGGANFPDKKPWEGGKKIWYDSMFVLRQPEGEWIRLEQHLPEPLAYAVSVGYGGEVVVVGGETTKPGREGSQYTDHVFAMSLQGTKIAFRDLPALPQPISAACGAIVGSRVYLAGGSASPTATSTLRTFLCLDLGKPASEQKWVSLPPWPGPARMLATAASGDGNFYLMGGTDLSQGDDGLPQRHYLQDAYCYREETGWTTLPNLPRGSVAAPSPAPFVDGHVVLISGDDGKQLLVEPAKHRGFPHELLAYDSRNQQWKAWGNWESPVVTVSTVAWRDGWQFVSGELRPGIRSPKVWRLTVKKESR